MVNLPLAGSTMVTPRFARSIGKSLADGWSDPFLQKSGLLLGCRLLAANQTRAFSSSIRLCGMVWEFHSFSSPQYAEGASGGPAVGVLGSRTGSWTVVAVCFTGSRMGTRSVLFSVAP